jgi:lipid-binding SYLF domain-containing protein
MRREYPVKYKIIINSLFVIFLLSYSFNLVHAASSVELDAKVDATLKEFYWKVGSGKELAEKAKGILVFPSVLKAGFWIGGQYGEGALRINGKTAGYYNIAGASFGFQFGAQSKSIILLFMTAEALSGFKNSSGWEAGVDGSVALATLGAGGALDTNTLQQPIIGFVFSNKGLMIDVSLKGSKITKINK